MFLSNLPEELKIKILNNLDEDQDLMNTYHVDRKTRNSSRSQIHGMILKKYLDLHCLDKYIVEFYSNFNILKYLEFVFDTPRNNYTYDPFTTTWKSRGRPSLFRSTKIISKKSKNVDGLTDLFY